MRRVYVAVERTRSLCSHPTHQVYLFIAFKGQFILLDFREISKDSGSQKLQRSGENPTFSHLSNALTKGFQTINSAPIDRAPGARSKSDEFLVWNPIFSTLDLILCLKRLKRLLHLLGSGVRVLFPSHMLLSPAGLLGRLAEVADQDRTAVLHVPRGGRAARSTTCSALLHDAASLLFWAPGAVGDFVLQCISDRRG